MRTMWVALLGSGLLGSNLRADFPPQFDDAALHAVQFVDRDEGWAVGDDGVIWHTIDGGRTWERQPTGVRASLRSLHFLNPFTGWVVGREELPQEGGSAGILLFTQDGGLKWQRAGRFSLPGLNGVRFQDNKTGYVAGDGTDQFPTGVFATRDGGRTWKPVPGPRYPSWTALDFQDGKNPTCILAGAWNRLGMLRDGVVTAADVDVLGGRNLRGLQRANNRAVAVGQGGLVFLSDTAGARWGYADLPFPTEVRANWDFHAVHCMSGKLEKIWIAGRPGSKILYSPDGGKKWEVQDTGQPLPLNGIYFIDEECGWSVGEFGTILNTTDRGKTWKIQRRGGHRAAVLFLHARPHGFPLDTVAVLGGQEGYLTVGVRVQASDAASAPPSRAVEGERLAAAMRQAGGAGGEIMWQFPAPQHLAQADKRELLQNWDRLHADRAAEQLLRQLILAIRIWKPSVLITDHPDSQVTGYPGDALLAEAVQEAFTRAADPSVFPEQIQALGLEPWKADKLYGLWEGRTGAQIMMDSNDPQPGLGGSARDFATPAAALLLDKPPLLPSQRYYRLLESRLEGAKIHKDLMEGISLTPHGPARREVKRVPDEAEVLKTLRMRRNLQALAEIPAGQLTDPVKLLAQVGPILKTLPDDQGAAAAFAVATQYARLGQWPFAREMFLLLVDRYPAQALSADAYRWLIRHNTSSEARRRQELGQFVLLGETGFQNSPAEGKVIPPELNPKVAPTIKGKELNPKVAATIKGMETARVQANTLSGLSNRAEARQWYEGSLDLGKRLAALGPIYATDPSIQFCLQAARRQLGDYEGAKEWYMQFCKEHESGPWRDAAATELWFTNRTGQPPKPVAVCRRTSSQPYLDGNFDDTCWQGLKPLVLGNAIGTTSKEYPTEAWLAYDAEFLYLALRCRHPEGRSVEPVKVRSRDVDLRAFDRVSLLLDLDRDYATYFHLQMDQRGCVSEDCWGDLSWNPKWYVAVHSDKTSWQIEAAIPLEELTGEGVTVGKAWAFNIVRVLPGRGVQAWSTPADVQPRPEGMGLLLFTAESPESKKPETDAAKKGPVGLTGQGK